MADGGTMKRRQRIEELRHSVRQLLRKPVRQLDRKARLAAYQLRLWWFVIRKMNRDRMLQATGALSFQTLLSLIPITLLFFLLVNAIVPDEQLRTRLRSFVFQQLSLEDVRYIELDRVPDAPAPRDEPDDDDAGPFSAMDAERIREAQQAQEQTVAAWLSERMDRLLDRSGAETRAPLTIFSIILLLIGGMSIFTIVEWSFNTVWEVPRGRSFLKRFYGLLTSLVLVTLLLGVAMWGVLQISVIAADSPLAGLWQLLGRLVPLLTSWLIFFALYKMVPNVFVQTRPALIAAVVSGTAWEFGAKLGFELYVRHATGVAQLYGNLALIPVFMFWVWLSWLILMFGAELSYVIQHMNVLTREQLQGKSRRFLRADLASLALALVITRRFYDDQSPPTANHLAALLCVPEGDVRMILDMMHQAHVVRCAERDEDGDEGYVPARPPQLITVAQVMQTGQRLQHSDGSEAETGLVLTMIEQYVQQFASAAHQQFQSTTLEALADELGDSIRQASAGDCGS